MKKFLNYLISIAIPVAVGAIVGVIMANFIDYEVLKQPPLAPPQILFPIMWTILYIIMGISYGILRDKGLLDKKSNILYFAQLFVNALWSIIFFIWKLRLLAIFWIVLLAVLVIAMIVDFIKKNKVAGLLQIPYICWTSFATYLTIAFYVLNK
jgi:tryptophan-rich sensory protein